MPVRYRVSRSKMLSHTTSKLQPNQSGVLILTSSLEMPADDKTKVWPKPIVIGIGIGLSFCLGNIANLIQEKNNRLHAWLYFFKNILTCYH